MASIAIQDDVVGTKMGVFIVSLGLLDLEADNVKEKGESDENKKLMTNSASSSDTKPSVEWHQDAIAKLEAEERALQHIHQGQQGTDCLLQETASVL